MDPASSTPLIDSLWADATKIAAITNSVIFTVGLVFTIIQLMHLRESRRRSTLADVFARVAAHNSDVVSDEYQRRAVEVFLNLPIDRSKTQPPLSENADKLYWGARALHLSHINLILQIWLVCGRPKRMRREYSGWQKFAKVVADDLSGKSSRTKPEWYFKACIDIWSPFLRGTIYPDDFRKWMDQLSTLDS